MEAPKKIDIPDRHQEFCKSIAKLAAEFGLNQFHGQYTPDFRDEWRAKIQFSWDSGRHGDSADRIYISSQLDVHTLIGPPKPPR